MQPVVQTIHQIVTLKSGILVYWVPDGHYHRIDIEDIEDIGVPLWLSTWKFSVLVIFFLVIFEIIVRLAEETPYDCSE